MIGTSVSNDQKKVIINNNNETRVLLFILSTMCICHFHSPFLTFQFSIFISELV